ncbi:MAG: zinc dependent phospholipase C family protein [Candidatus Alkaliphilus sp. MAG34]|nr:zinc dependent phospholipase C family protein [Clostridiales bacterium]
MLPQTHKIISEHVYNNIKETFNVKLNKRSLIYGSIKPDIAYSLVKLDHFKPQSFDFICDEINKLSNYRLELNKEFIKFFSRRIGIVTHFISDFFCVPHNDRVTYENNFIDHIRYEHQLHQLFKSFDGRIHISKGCFNIGNDNPDSIRALVDAFHLQYIKKDESFVSDLYNSIHVSSIVGLFIIYNMLNNNITANAA